MEGALDYNMVSIVIPVYNEEESVPLLYKSIKKGNGCYGAEL